MPSVPKLSALARVYERPISDLVDVYESVARAGLAPKRASLVHLQELGIHALSAGKYAKALACFERALDAATTARIAGERLAIMYHAMGRALTKAGRFLTARQYLEEALRAVESMPIRAKLIRDLAVVHAGLGDTILAELLSRGAERLEGGGQHRRKRGI